MSAPESSVAAARAPRKRRWLALAVLTAYVIAVAAGGIYTDHLRPLPDPKKPVNGWQWWVTPHEQNAFMRMPVITGQLNGMDVSPDGQILVLVGDEDFLLTSADAGRTWIRGTVTTGAQPPSTPAPKGAFNFSFGLTGTAYAEAPVSEKTKAPDLSPNQAKREAKSQATAPDAKGEPKQTTPRKRGKGNVSPLTPNDEPPALPVVRLDPKSAPKPADADWDKIDAKPGSKPRLRDISIVDQRTFIAVGDDGLILRTNDAGRSWSRRASATQRTLRAIACTRNTCFAAGWPGTVVRTADAGETWVSAGLDRAYDFVAIFSLNDGTWLAIDSLGRLCTLDADAKVIAESDPKLVDGDPLIVDVTFDRSRTTGVLATRSQRVLLSTDSGRSWQTVETPVGATVQSAGIDAAGHVVIMGGDPLRMYATQDLGKHWSAPDLTAGRASPREAAASRPRIRSTERGDLFVLAPDNTLIRRTAEGSWSQLALGSSAFLALEMLSSQRGLIAGSAGTVLSSDDGGETWEPRASGVDFTLENIAFGDDERALALGEPNSVQRAGVRTTDAGRSWSPFALADYADVHSVTFVDPVHVFVRGRSLLLESMDAGNAWHAPLGPPWLTGFGFADGRHGVRTSLSDSLDTPSQQPQRLATFGTADGGRTWQPLPDVRTEWFRVNGRARYVLSAADGGEPVSFPGSLRLPANALQQLRDAREAAFNDEGVGISVPKTRDALLRTTNNGETWTEIPNPTHAPLESVRFAGKDRVVALAQGRVAVSDDAGETFRPVAYKRYPSPWLWLSSLLLVAGVLVYARSSINAPALDVGPPSIADAAASDRPIQWWDPDHAGLRDIALGLSRFLRNRKTDPPLTVAVTGEWGTGKSSLMNLLRHDLERYGYKPVWFNAWHHQSGENLLGSLLANIHAQGVPRFFSLAGLDFRVSLTAIRGRRLWLQACLILVVFAVVGFSYPVLKDKWFSFWSTLSRTGEGDFSNLKAATGVFGFALAVIWQLAGVVRMVSAFGLQPGKLIAAVASTSEDESARNQAGARYRFAREFEDFTRALEPRPLVVFIDDLDRCRAANVVETLEAVNFLVSSGRCIVVLGMARHWVETCVGLAFKELADAHVEAAPVAATDGSGEQQLFARHYLEKLINIEIRVPQLSDAAASAILQGTEPSAPHHDLRFALGTLLLRLGRWSAVTLALGAIGFTGHFIAQSFTASTAPEIAEVKAAQSTSVAPVADATPTVTSQAAINHDEKKAQTAIEIATLEPSRERTSTAWYWSGGVLAALAMLALASLALFARREARTDDSPAFREALRIWQPFILLGGASPRSLKRFINQLRYLAMRSRLGPDTTTAYERMAKRVRVFFGRNTPEVPSRLPPRRGQPLTEELLVALAALHRCDETWLHALLISGDYGELEEFLARELSDRLQNTEEREAVIARLVKAALAFNKVFSSSALFLNIDLDQARAQAFFELMALDDVPSSPPKIDPTPAPPQVTTTLADQFF
ncbi:MAG TPA: YCF48-related protein [Polyangiales bacterium]|nr:YCF48-related protein [Polyangiales bacterium]